MLYLFFIIFVIAILTCGTVYLGPFSLRVYMSVLMIAFLLFKRFLSKKKRDTIRVDYIYWFLICVFALFLSLIANGGLTEYGLMKMCLSHYIPCILLYFAVDNFIKSREDFDKLIFVFSCIIIFDSIVTILQYQNSPIGWGVGLFFSNEEEIESFLNYINSHDSLMGVSKLTGIFGHPVNNGFVISVLTPALITRISRDNKIIVSIYYIMAVILALIASFLLQQRAAFFLLVFFILYHIYKKNMKRNGRIIFLVFLFTIVILFFNMNGSEILESSKLSNSDNSVRASIWEIGLSVFTQNPIFGDYIGFWRMSDEAPHNAFIGSMAFSGLVGLIPFAFLYLKTLLDSIKVMLSKNSYAQVFSYSVFIFVGVGQFHNISFLTGEVIIFLILALMFKSSILTKPYEANRKQNSFQRSVQIVG